MSTAGRSIIQAVREVAADNPLHVFEGQCLYVKSGRPACLIGQALWKLAVIGPGLEARGANEGGVEEILNTLAIQVDAEELHWLELVQGYQDNDHTWHDSVRLADPR